MRYLLPIALLFLVLVSACSKDDDTKNEPKKSNFSVPEEYMENPSVAAAINQSGISVNKGDNAPSMEGIYLLDGEVIDASDMVNSLIGMPIISEIKLYNQTTSGEIDFQENYGDLTAGGSGGFITGDNGKFTIWQESRQSGSEAGLPDDLTVNVVLLMSGTRLNNGDLSAKGISIITEVNTINTEYDGIEALEGIWWIWDCDFDLQAGKSATIQLKNKNNSFASQEILQLIIEKSVK